MTNLSTRYVAGSGWAGVTSVSAGLLPIVPDGRLNVRTVGGNTALATWHVDEPPVLGRQSFRFYKNGAVTFDKLAVSAVQGDRIRDGAISAAKLAMTRVQEFPFTLSANQEQEMSFMIEALEGSPVPAFLFVTAIPVVPGVTYRILQQQIEVSRDANGRMKTTLICTLKNTSIVRGEGILRVQALPM